MASLPWPLFRYQPITATIPVILMTGDPDESGRRLAMEIGADDYLAKPFTLSSLLAAVHVQLKKREAIRQQALNLKPSDADRAEVKAVAETATPSGGRQEIGEADQTERTVRALAFRGPNGPPGTAPRRPRENAGSGHRGLRADA